MLHSVPGLHPVPASLSDADFEHLVLMEVVLCVIVIILAVTNTFVIRKKLLG